MQSEAHVVTAAHILGQARGIVKPGLIEMNSECFRRMIDRFKALRAGPEKRAKAIDAIVSDDGCHIRKHDETDAVRLARSSHQRRLTAARGADPRYRLVEGVQQGSEERTGGK